MNALRIGQGWDIHALVEGRPLILGGVTIPHRLGLKGHSDADALLHAITDALLGAAGLAILAIYSPTPTPALPEQTAAVCSAPRGRGWLQRVGGW